VETSEAIATWWATLTPEQRVDAKTAVERSAVPHWMARDLTDRFGSAVLTTWWEGDPSAHPAPYRTTTEIAELIGAQDDA
jgi:hypothetical protein